MCGISGIVLNGEIPFKEIEHEVHQMNELQKHRGPDNEGILVFNSEGEVVSQNEAVGRVGFGHRRLSIIDLSPEANQPMFDESKSHSIIFNGEIFNYIEIRNELLAAGISFQTQSDTEVMLKGYLHWGTSFYEKIEGMWAFAMYDIAKNTIVLSRDRTGVKPLFYTHDKKGFRFASEIKALLPFTSNDVHLESLQKFISKNQFQFGTDTFFSEIQELKPGYELRVNPKTLQTTISAYFNPYDVLVDEKTFSKSTDELSEELHEILTKVILQHSRSDVPVGSCLSGGLDSSTIVGLLRTLDPTISIPVFSAIFKENEIDESELISASVQKHNLAFNPIEPTSEEFLKTLEKVAYAQEFPLISTSTFAQYKVMERASQLGTKVLINGQGADELLGGYFKYGLFQQKQNLYKFQFLKAQKGPANLKLQFKSMAKDTLSKFDVLDSFFKKDLQFLNLELRRGKEDNSQPLGNLNEYLLHDYYNGFLAGLLRAEDRNSMNFSIESRVPFASSHKLAQWAFGLPSKHKFNQKINKPLLRNMLTKYDIIPKSILAKENKLGFSTPMNQWLYNNHEELIQYIDYIPIEFCDTKKLKSSLHSQMINNNSFIEEKPSTFKWISLGIWFKVFKNR